LWGGCAVTTVVDSKAIDVMARMGTNLVGFIDCSSIVPGLNIVGAVVEDQALSPLITDTAPTKKSVANIFY
jgi:hypothetical protein